MSACVHAQTSNVLQSCSVNRDDLGATTPRLAVASLLHECINDTGEGRTNGRPLRFVAPDTSLMRALSRMGNISFAQTTGVTVNFALLTPFLNYSLSRQRYLQDPKAPNATEGYDLLMATATAFGDAAQVEGKLPDLSYLVAGDAGLSWNEIPAQFRAVGATYDGSIRALPLIFSSFMQYYHLDIFRRDNLTVPQTWDEFTELAERYHGRDGLLGACVMPIDCKAESLILRAIFGSYVQTEGSSHGMFWDPKTLEPLVNTPAMEAALKIFRRLRAVGPQASDAPLCMRYHFIKGRCLLAIADGALFKTGSIGSSDLTQMRGHMGLAPIPGTAYVLDRTTKQLVPCTEKRCPLAQGKTAEGILVNRPIAMSSTILLVNGLSPFQYQFFAYQLAAYLSSPAVVGTRGLLLDANELQPVREADLSLDKVPLWAAKGYDAGDVTRYLTTYREMVNNPNINADLRLRLTTNVTEALVAAAVLYNNISLNASLSKVMAQIEAVLNWIVATEGREAFASQYRRSLNWAPQTADRAGTVSSAKGQETGQGTKRTVPIAVGTICGALLISSLGLAAFVVHRRRASRGAHINLVEAPGVGHQTTLCITDIQDSTTLWEELSDVMNVALDVHHSVIRKLLVVHRGYECLTEGDSFIVAFHMVAHAAHFCLDVQQALLEAPWPRELLRHESAARGSNGESPTSEITLLKQGSLPSAGTMHSGKAFKKRALPQGRNQNASQRQQQQEQQQRQPQQQQQVQKHTQLSSQLAAGRGSNVTTNPCVEDPVAAPSADPQGAPTQGLASQVLADPLYTSNEIIDTRQYPPQSEDGNGGSLLYSTVDRTTPNQFESTPPPLPTSLLGTHLTVSHYSQQGRLGQLIASPAAAPPQEQPGSIVTNDAINNNGNSFKGNLRAIARPVERIVATRRTSANAVVTTAVTVHPEETALSDDDAIAVISGEAGSNGGGSNGGGSNGGAAGAESGAGVPGAGGAVFSGCSGSNTGGAGFAGATGSMGGGIGSRTRHGNLSLAARSTAHVPPGLQPVVVAPPATATAAVPVQVLSPMNVEPAAPPSSRNGVVGGLKALLGGLTNARSGGAAGAGASVVPLGNDMGIGRFFRREHPGGGCGPVAVGAVPTTSPSADVSTSDLPEPMAVWKSTAPEDMEYDLEKAQRHRLGRIHEYDTALPYRILHTEARSMSVPAMQRPPGLIVAGTSPNAAPYRPAAQRIAARPSFSGPAPPPPSMHVPSRLSGNRPRKSVTKTISATSLVEAVRGVGDLGRLTRLDWPRSGISQRVTSKRLSRSSTATDFSIMGTAVSAAGPTAGASGSAVDGAATGAGSGAPGLTLDAMIRAAWRMPQPRRSGADSLNNTLPDCSAAVTATGTAEEAMAAAPTADQGAASWAVAGSANVDFIPGDGGATAAATPLSVVTSGSGGAAVSGGFVVFRGLRVRAGLSCGVLSESDILRETVSGRVQYTGRCMRLAKLVSDAAHGGMVLLSDTARAALEADSEGWAAVVKRCQPLVLWMGRHSLAEDLGDVHLFQMVSQALAGRLALLQRPLRTLGMQRPLMGIMSAPMVLGAAARLVMPGASTLLSWDAEVTSRALDIAYVALMEELRRAKGRPYVVEGAQGLYYIGGCGGGALASGGGDAAGGGLASAAVSSLLPVDRSMRLPGAGGGVEGRGGGGGSVPNSAMTSGLLPQSSMELVGLSITSPPSAGRQRLSKSAKEGGIWRPGVMTVVFDSVDAAATWLLQALEILPLLPWPAELLEHPLCEPLDLDMLSAVVTGQEANPPLPGCGSPPRRLPRRRDSFRSIFSAATGRSLNTRRATTQGSMRLRPSGDSGREEVSAFGNIQERNPEIITGHIVVDDPDSPRTGQVSVTTVGSASPLTAATMPPKARGRPDFSGLRAAGALSFGDLGGHLPVVGNLSGQVQYKGRAWHALAKLSAKARVGQVCTNMATVGYLRPEVASLMVVVKGAQDT